MCSLNPCDGSYLGRVANRLRLEKYNNKAFKSQTSWGRLELKPFRVSSPLEWLDLTLARHAYYNPPPLPGLWPAMLRQHRRSSLLHFLLKKKLEYLDSFSMSCLISCTYYLMSCEQSFEFWPEQWLFWPINYMSFKILSLMSCEQSYVLSNLTVSSAYLTTEIKKKSSGSILGPLLSTPDAIY